MTRDLPASPTPGEPVKGDWFMDRHWGPMQFDRFDDSERRAFLTDLKGQVRLLVPAQMTFIGRPDADGWMPWSGGENPVPGQMVEVKLRYGSQRVPQESDGLRWRSRDNPDPWDIIAFRLVSAEPDRAEGGERDYPMEFEAWWATYRHRNRDVADYNVKKQIAFDAFYHAARQAPPAPAVEGEGDPQDVLRAAGWSVAVHNDYRLNGAAHTFWLWTHPNGTWIKGEGATDRDALSQCLAALSSSPSQEQGGAVAWISPDDAVVWGEYIITDGENVAIAQKAEADYGGTYWSVETGGGAIMWEPTRCIALDENAAHPQQQGAVEVARKALEKIVAEVDDVGRKALEFYAGDHANPNEGPWGVNSNDFGSVARKALAALSTSAKETGQ